MGEGAQLNDNEEATKKVHTQNKVCYFHNSELAR